MKLPDTSAIYEFLKTIGAFAGLAGLAKWCYNKFQNRLTRREKELLVAAREWGGPIILFTQGGNVDLQVSGRDIGGESAPNSEYVDALETLVGRSLMRGLDGPYFALTARGEKLADLYERSIPAESIAGGAS